MRWRRSPPAQRLLWAHVGKVRGWLAAASAGEPVAVTAEGLEAITIADSLRREIPRRSLVSENSQRERNRRNRYNEHQGSSNGAPLVVAQLARQQQTDACAEHASCGRDQDDVGQVQPSLAHARHGSSSKLIGVTVEGRP